MKFFVSTNRKFPNSVVQIVTKLRIWIFTIVHVIIVFMNLHFEAFLQHLHQFLWRGSLQVEWGYRGIRLSRSVRGGLREETHHQQQARRPECRRVPFLLLRNRLCWSGGTRDTPRRRRFAAKRCVLAQQTLVQRLQALDFTGQPLVHVHEVFYPTLHLIHLRLLPVAWGLRRYTVLQLPGDKQTVRYNNLRTLTHS